MQDFEDKLEKSKYVSIVSEAVNSGFGEAVMEVFKLDRLALGWSFWKPHSKSFLYLIALPLW